MKETYKLYLQDLVVLLKERLEQAKKDQVPEDDFKKGISFGLYESLSLIASQAEAFGIPLNEIGLDGYVLENYI